MRDRPLVHVDRSFRDIDAEDLNEPEHLSMLRAFGLPTGTGWDELLLSERVVVLAEAGSGKTHEMQQLTSRLVADGRSAFFVPLEMLADQDLPEILAAKADDGERFENWRTDDSAPAWFFLDAVDELKLHRGTLRRALTRVARALGDARARANVVLSSRPTDWQPGADLDTFREYLPPTHREAMVVQDQEADVVDPLLSELQEPDASKSEPRIVVLLPLDKKQIETFAVAAGVDDTNRFLEAIQRSDVEAFAGRPLDLLGLIDGWIAEGGLPTRLEHHQRDVLRSLRDDPDRPDAEVLSSDQAAEGAKRLALALTMTRMRTMAVPDRTPDSGALIASDVLTDWTSAQISSLLRRPLFDPATYGRVRFHHRSIQEYLAAERLADLRQKGLPVRTLMRALFSDRYGEHVVIPSMRPIAGWLSLRDADVRREALVREPEVLVVEGDPQSLDHHARCELLRHYIERYGAGGWRRLEMPISQIRRLAQPDLADDVAATWAAPHENEEVREFLLKLIWLGPLLKCAEIAFEAARSRDFSPYARIIGIRALATCDRSDLARSVASDMLNDPDGWPAQIIHSSIDDLFPAVMTLDELENLLRRIPEPRNTVGGFEWGLFNLVDGLDPHDPATIELRERLAALIREGCVSNSDIYCPSSSFSHLTPALVKLCLRQFQSGRTDSQLVVSSVVAIRYHADNTTGREQADELRMALREAAVRKEAFLSDLALNDQINPEMDPRHRLFTALHQGVLGQISGDDEWPLEKVTAASTEADRVLFIHAAIQAWVNGGRRPEVAEDLLSRVSDDDVLLALVEGEINPPPREPSEAVRRLHRRQEERAAEEAKKEERWQNFQHQVTAIPSEMFSSEQLERTVNLLLDWLRGRGDDQSSIVFSGWRFIRKFFGDHVGDIFEAYLLNQWRNTPPPLISGPLSEAPQISRRRCVALTGLLVEAASSSEWAVHLEADEALRAAQWATLELNGFPEWLGMLANVHPTAVTEILEVEISAELGETATNEHPHNLSAVQHGPENVRLLLVPALKARLLDWPQPIKDEQHDLRQATNLDRVLTILVEAGCMDAYAADECETRFRIAPTTIAGGVWLSGLCAQDLERGCRVIRDVLAEVPEEQRGALGQRWVRILFGDRGFFRVPVGLDAPVTVIVDLIKLAYDVVRLDDDLHHEGVFTPGERDDAQDARSRLLGALIELAGQDAHDALVELADDGRFAHMPDRLRMLARERAAIDSEPEPMTTAAFHVWEARFATPPGNRDALFQVMVDRLEDIEFDVRHHDFGDRRWLRDVEDEREMQARLSTHLQDRQRDDYQVIREDEVADAKKPDIRLLARAFPGRAAIEIKIGDSWSVRELEEAVRDQLVGQYLRAAECSVGALWVTYAGRKGFQHPETGQKMTFEAVVQQLQAYAAQIEAGENGRIRIAVLRLDLRDPLRTS
tara:strand:- start:240 stop:4535 length:4296 start_codon:yes stop_codon:yes gene_type:complete